MLRLQKGAAHAVGKCLIGVCDQAGGEGVECPGERLVVSLVAVGLAGVDFEDQPVRGGGDEVDELVWSPAGEVLELRGGRRFDAHVRYITTLRGNVHIAW